MHISNTLYVTDRKRWREWLRQHHTTEPEVWLVYYRKNSGKPCIPYDDAVEEAVCFGWIDSTVKKLDDERTAQRFTPRKPQSKWSELNKERARRLIECGRMRAAGFAKLGTALEDDFEVPADIIKELKADKRAWENFQRFPESYKRIRVGFIEAARKRPNEFRKRLTYFLKMTAQGKKFGTMV